LHLASTEEWVDGTFSGNLGEVLIRCVRRGGGDVDKILCSAHH
jgi:hypothetical protein